ncbi:unnamed protein product, partial [Prorocentrum cordatum]
GARAASAGPLRQRRAPGDGPYARAPQRAAEHGRAGQRLPEAGGGETAGPGLGGYQRERDVRPVGAEGDHHAGEGEHANGGRGALLREPLHPPHDRQSHQEPAHHLGGDGAGRDGPHRV